MKCPICNSGATLKYNLQKDFIISKLVDYYNSQIAHNTDLGIIDYGIYKCDSCTLEYSYPLIHGTETFYEWICSHKTYYPSNRWEWNIVIKYLNNILHNESINILEIGCGNGIFLEKITNLPNINAVGLDTTSSSVENCIQKGISAHCTTIDSFLPNNNGEQLYFDTIVAFHCLEHVASPKDFVSSMLKLLKKAGKIYLSTPYSPMSFEPFWFDPLNHPPHHLTRWNIASYQELAKQLGLNISFILPPATKNLDRALYSLNLAWNGPANLTTKYNVLLTSLLKPATLIKEIIRQIKREKINNQVAPNVVLVELSRINMD